MTTLPPRIYDIPILHTALQIANRTVLEDIRSESHAVHTDGGLYYDLRPMTDPREHSPMAVDMATQAIVYAIESGLIVPHPDPKRAHLVRITNPNA